MSIVLVGSSSGSITLQEPAVAGTTTLNLPATSGTVVVTGTTPTLNGITFPATQVPSADANTLDDYEEGTFTPTLTAGVTSPTYIAQAGFYTKIGRQVNFSILVSLSGGTRNSNRMVIGGLPFTSAGTAGYFSGAYFSYANRILSSASTSNIPILYIQPSNSNMEFYKTDGDNFTGNDLSAVNFDAYIVGAYFST